MKDRDDSKLLGDIIQLDDVYWGCEQRDGKKKGGGNKVPFVATVSADETDHPISMNIHVIKGFHLNEIGK